MSGGRFRGLVPFEKSREGEPHAGLGKKKSPQRRIANGSGKSKQGIRTSSADMVNRL